MANTSLFRKRRYHKYRVLMLAEYSNSTEDFEAQYPDFLRLLNKMHLLSDDMLLDYLAEPLSQCRASGSAGAGVASSASANAGAEAGTALLRLSISEVGFPSITDASGLTRACAESAVGPFRFAATSATRNVERTYDFSKPLKPAWLAQGTYVEERAPSEPKPASPVGEPEAGAPTPAEPPSTPNAGEPPPAPPDSTQAPGTSEAAPDAPAP